MFIFWNRLKIFEYLGTEGKNGSYFDHLYVKVDQLIYKR